MSAAPDPDPPAWLAVLPAQVSGEELSALCARLRARGWSADSSRGEEQVVVAVDGPASVAEVRSALGSATDADVIRILGADEYRRLRARRRFQSALVTGLGLLVLAGLTLPLAGFLRPPPATILAPDLVRVARADELAVGAARPLRLSDRPVLVLRDAPERWHALSAACTFMDDCLLEWDQERKQAVCPCHGCAFDAHGNVVHAPASLPLLRLEVVAIGDGLYLRRTL